MFSLISVVPDAPPEQPHLSINLTFDGIQPMLQQCEDVLPDLISQVRILVQAELLESMANGILRDWRAEVKAQVLAELTGEHNRATECFNGQVVEAPSALETKTPALTMPSFNEDIQEQVLLGGLSQMELDKLSAAVDSPVSAPLPPVPFLEARQISISHGVTGDTEDMEVPDDYQTISDLKSLLAAKHSVPRSFIVITCVDSIEDDRAHIKFDDSTRYTYVMKVDWDEISSLEELNDCGVKLCRQWLRDRHQIQLWSRFCEEVHENTGHDQKWVERSFLEFSFLHGGPDLTMATLMETRSGTLETDFFRYKSGDSEMGKSPFAQAMTFGWIEIGEYLVENFRNYVLVNEVIGIPDTFSDHHEDLDRGDSWGFSALLNPYDGFTPLMAAILLCVGGGFDKDDLKPIGRRFLNLILSYANLDVNYKIRCGEHSGTTALGMSKEFKLRDVWDLLRSRCAGLPSSNSCACPMLTVTCAELTDIERLHVYFMEDNHIRLDLFKYEVFDAEGKQVHVAKVADLTTMQAHCPLTIKFSRRETEEAIEDISFDLIYNCPEDLTPEVVTKHCAEKGISFPDPNYDLQLFDSTGQRAEGKDKSDCCFPVTFKFVKFHYSLTIAFDQVRQMRGFEFVQIGGENMVEEKFVVRVVKDFLHEKGLKIDQVSTKYVSANLGELNDQWCFSITEFPMTVRLFTLNGDEKETEAEVTNDAVWDVQD